MAHSRSLRTGQGFRPQKRLGQHFLVESHLIHQIIAHAKFQVSDLVLEIGPGRGALTLPLAQSVGHVVAVEKDAYLARELKEKLSHISISNVTIVINDILKWGLSELKLLSSAKAKVIGNLPYNISSPFLEKLVENRILLSRAVLMFQREVAQRLVASPGTKAYGALTLLVRYHAHTTMLLEVPKEAFYPRPKVDSMVVELDFERPYPQQSVHEETFKKVVKGAFAHRRKTIINSLKGYGPFWDQEQLLEAMNSCGIDPGKRAEVLDMDEYLCLTRALALTSRHQGDI